MPQIYAAIKRRHSFNSWESEITLVERARNQVLGLRFRPPEIVNLNYSFNSPFLLTIKNDSILSLNVK